MRSEESHTKIEKGGIITQRRIRDHRECAILGWRDRAWNLRATGLTVICILSTQWPSQGLFSVLFTFAHSHLFCSNSSPHTGCLHGHDLLPTGPVALQQQPGSPLPRITPQPRGWLKTASKRAQSTATSHSRAMHLCQQATSVMLQSVTTHTSWQQQTHTVHTCTHSAAVMYMWDYADSLQTQLLTLLSPSYKGVTECIASMPELFFWGLSSL